MIFKKTPEDFGKREPDENGGEGGDFKEALQELIKEFFSIHIFKITLYKLHLVKSINLLSWIEEYLDRRTPGANK